MQATGLSCYIGNGGSIVIPEEIRRKFKLNANSKLNFFYDTENEDVFSIMKEETDQNSDLKEFIDNFKNELKTKLEDFNASPALIKSIERYIKNINDIIDEEF